MGDARIALLFPGQGCQFVGMGRELYESVPESRALWNLADDILGFGLTDLCFAGPDEILNDTANTQPAIYVVTMAFWELLRPRLEPVRERIAFMAGHSLGEFSALTASGALSFADGLRLVRHRGEAMRDAGQEAPGGMAAIIGLDDVVVQEIVEAAGPGVWVANFNSPGQVVIAGEEGPLALALALAQERQAKRAIALAVSVACHTPLMQGAAGRLGQALAEVELCQPWAPVVSNVQARPLSQPDQIRAALLAQLSSPVRWVESVEAMVSEGATTMIEVGPKAVVSGLVKRIDRGVTTYAVTDVGSLDALDLEAL